MADSALLNGRAHRKSKGTSFALGTATLADQLRRDPAGQWTDNRLEQSQHYRGIIYIAIRALMDALLSSTIQLNRKHRRYHATSLRRLEKARGETEYAKSLGVLDAEYAPRFGRARRSGFDAMLAVRNEYNDRLERLDSAYFKALPTPHSNTQDEQFRPFDDPDHSLVKLIDQPNRTETFNELLAQMVMQYSLTGSALLWANPGERIPVPRELYVLPTALCYAQPPTPIYPEGWWRVTQYYPAGGYGILPSPIAGGGAPVDGRDIFVFKNPHPLWRWDAYSPLTAGGVQLDILESIDQARWTAMDMGLTPDMVLLAPGVNQEQLNVYLERLKQTNIGKRNHRKVMAIGGDQGDSKFDVKFPSTTAKDMDFSGGWDQMTAFALALFGVPKSVAGLATTGSYAELYAALKQFHTNTLRPLVSRLGVWLTRHLARIWGDDLAIQIDLPTIDDQQLQEQQLATDLAHDGLTYNEYRATRGRKPVPGGDVLCSVYVQQQQAKAQQAMQAQQPPQAAPGQPGAPQPGAEQPPANAGPQPSSPNGPPSAGAGGGGGAAQQAAPAPADPNADPLSQLLGTPTPGGDDGHVQNSVAEAALGALGVPSESTGTPTGPVGTPTTVAKSYTALYEKAGPKGPNAPVGVPKPKKVGAPTGTPPDKPANVPAASDSQSKDQERGRTSGEVYPSDSGAIRQQTPEDTSAPAPVPKATPNAVTPNPPLPPTAKRLADSPKQYGAGYQPAETTPARLSRQDSDQFPSGSSLRAPPGPAELDNDAPPVTPTKPGGAAPKPYRSSPSAQPTEPTASPTEPAVPPSTGGAPAPAPSPPPLPPKAVQNWLRTLHPEDQAHVAQWVNSVRTGGRFVPQDVSGGMRLLNALAGQPQRQQYRLVPGEMRRPPSNDPAENTILDQLASEAKRTGTLPSFLARGLPPEHTAPVAPREETPPQDRAAAARAALGKNAPPEPITDHASLIRAMANHPDYVTFGKTPEERASNLERWNPAYVRQLAQASGLPLPPEEAKAAPVGPRGISMIRPVAPKEQITALANAGQFPPAEDFAPHAAQVPADTPAAKAVLANVGSWVAPLAAQHAQKVADHFGIDVPRATKLLTHAINAIATHAVQKGNPNNPTAAVTIAGRPGTLTASAGMNPLTVRLHPRRAAAIAFVNDMTAHLRAGHSITDEQAAEYAASLDHMTQDDLVKNGNVTKRDMTRTDAREVNAIVKGVKQEIAANPPQPGSVGRSLRGAAAGLAAGALAGGQEALAGAPAAPFVEPNQPAIIAPAPAQPDMRNPLAPPANVPGTRTPTPQLPPPNVPSAGAPPEPTVAAPPTPTAPPLPRVPGPTKEIARPPEDESPIPEHLIAGNEHLRRLQKTRQDFENTGKDTTAIDRHIARVVDSIRGAGHAPDVAATDENGITKAARVGALANEVPDKIPRLPNLSPRERFAETKFAEWYEKNPDGAADAFTKLVEASAAKKGGPPEFGTDDAKLLSTHWEGAHLTPEKRAQNRATLNTALHQTANAIAKRAFVKHLDTLKPGDQVMVTVGGVGAGKGFGLKHVPKAKELKAQSKAIWDSAGDQSATENPWVQKELEKRGLKGVYVYTHVNPYDQWKNPNKGVIKRAGDPSDGRMVDAHVFADSYAIGAKNHQKFVEQNRNNPNAKFVFIDNSSWPKEIPGIPPGDLNLNRHDLARYAIRELHKSNAPEHVKHGGSQGTRIWGAPEETPPEPLSEGGIARARKLLAGGARAANVERTTNGPPPARRKFPIPANQRKALDAEDKRASQQADDSEEG